MSLLPGLAPPIDDSKHHCFSCLERMLKLTLQLLAMDEGFAVERGIGTNDLWLAFVVNLYAKSVKAVAVVVVVVVVVAGGGGGSPVAINPALPKCCRCCSELAPPVPDEEAMPLSTTARYAECSG